MKKLLAITLFATLAFNSTSQALYWGPTGGLNISSLTRTTGSETVYKGNFGLMVGLQLTNTIGIQAEGLISWQGGSFLDPIYELGQQLQFKTIYAKVPVLIKINLIAGLNFEAGASFDFILDSSVEGYEDLDDIETPINDQINKFDLSIPIGINYLFFNKLEVGVRYYIPTVSVTNLSELADWKAKNSLFTINIRFRF